MHVCADASVNTINKSFTLRTDRNPGKTNRYLYRKGLPPTVS